MVGLIQIYRLIVSSLGCEKSDVADNRAMNIYPLQLSRFTSKQTEKMRVQEWCWRFAECNRVVKEALQTEPKRDLTVHKLFFDGCPM